MIRIMTKKERNPEDLKISKRLIANFIYLVKESKLSQSQIATLANLPHTTVNGIMKKTSINPKIHTLASLARVFNKSIGQMLGEIPLHFSTRPIPVLDWNNLEAEKNTVSDQTTNFISTHIQSDNNIYAVSVDNKVSTLYQTNSLIIVEETKEFNNLDLAILSINNSKPTIKKILQEGNDIFLESVSHKIPTTKFEQGITRILGVIRETRF